MCGRHFRRARLWSRLTTPGHCAYTQSERPEIVAFSAEIRARAWDTADAVEFLDSLIGCGLPLATFWQDWQRAPPAMPIVPAAALRAGRCTTEWCHGSGTGDDGVFDTEVYMGLLPVGEDWRLTTISHSALQRLTWGRGDMVYARFPEFVPGPVVACSALIVRSGQAPICVQYPESPDPWPSGTLGLVLFEAQLSVDTGHRLRLIGPRPRRPR